MVLEGDWICFYFLFLTVSTDSVIQQSDVSASLMHAIGLRGILAPNCYLYIDKDVNVSSQTHAFIQTHIQGSLCKIICTNQSIYMESQTIFLTIYFSMRLSRFVLLWPGRGNPLSGSLPANTSNNEHGAWDHGGFDWRVWLPAPASGTNVAVLSGQRSSSFPTWRGDPPSRQDGLCQAALLLQGQHLTLQVQVSLLLLCEVYYCHTFRVRVQVEVKRVSFPCSNSDAVLLLWQGYVSGDQH